MADGKRGPRWDALATLRVDAGHTTASLGRAAGLSQNYVWEIENGVRFGRPGTLKKLANAFGMTTSQLLATRPINVAGAIGEDEDEPAADVA